MSVKLGPGRLAIAAAVIIQMMTFVGIVMMIFGSDVSAIVIGGLAILGGLGIGWYELVWVTFSPGRIEVKRAFFVKSIAASEITEWDVLRDKTGSYMVMPFLFFSDRRPLKLYSLRRFGTSPEYEAEMRRVLSLVFE